MTAKIRRFNNCVKTMMLESDPACGTKEKTIDRLIDIKSLRKRFLRQGFGTTACSCLF